MSRARELLAIAALLRFEANTYREGFCICRGSGKKRRYEWGDSSDQIWVRPRVEKLDAAALYLENLAAVTGKEMKP